METINDRIAWCIKDAGIKKAEFARRLNLSQPFVSELCSGKNNPSDRTIADICREFNISELWLRTGEGEPHIQRDEDEEFLEVMEQIHISDDDLIKRIIKAYCREADRTTQRSVTLYRRICGGMPGQA